ncbi:winged helix-turn-helix domain-containing protein [Millisia brevis]|uniref:winged helix-turn-helix domain-containing protein n=1 Tax=Millisia brevis TaxID=264148 RepID=UPI000835E9F0|nr:winged helix-turn-helix domain-containing protein [Millisia brevis]
MLIPGPILARVATGEVTVAFRAWLRPTVKAGGTLITRIGALAIDSVDPIDPATITAEDALRAGYAHPDAARAGLRAGEGRRVYRIGFHLGGDDPRIALREEVDLTDAQWSALTARLDRMDARSATGPWTREVLGLIRDNPAVVSTVLAEAIGLPRPELKTRIRRLKAMGLTESLDVGYRLSPRGQAALNREVTVDPTS